MFALATPRLCLLFIFILSSAAVIDSLLGGILLLVTLLLTVSIGSLYRSRTVFFLILSLVVALIATFLWAPYFAFRISFTDLQSVLILILLLPFFKIIYSRFTNIIFGLKSLNCIIWVMSVFSVIFLLDPSILTNYNKAALYNTLLLSMCLLRFMFSNAFRFSDLLPISISAFSGISTQSDSFKISLLSFIISFVFIQSAKLFTVRSKSLGISSDPQMSFINLWTPVNKLLILIMLLVFVASLPLLIQYFFIFDKGGIARDFSSLGTISYSDFNNSVRFQLQSSTINNILTNFFMPFGYVLTSYNITNNEFYESHSSYLEILKTYGFMVFVSPFMLKSIFSHSRHWYLAFLACTSPLLTLAFFHVIYRQPITIVSLIYIFLFVTSVEGSQTCNIYVRPTSSGSSVLR